MQLQLTLLLSYLKQHDYKLSVTFSLDESSSRPYSVLQTQQPPGQIETY